MKKTLKHIAVIVSIAAVISVVACSKKDNSPPAQNTIAAHTDFRDSLVGNYNCIDSYYVQDHMPPYTLTASNGGIAMVTVAKWTGDDSSVVINGNTYSYTSSDSNSAYFTAPAANTRLSYAHIGKHSDSIRYHEETFFGTSVEDYYYYVGRRN